MKNVHFEWDTYKEGHNQEKHGVSFLAAQQAFFDPKRVIAEDIGHSDHEKRYFCFGEVDDGILTVRFTYRGNTIRIIGAGYWRRGKEAYEEKNKIL